MGYVIKITKPFPCEGLFFCLLLFCFFSHHDHLLAVISCSSYTTHAYIHNTLKNSSNHSAAGKSSPDVIDVWNFKSRSPSGSRDCLARGHDRQGHRLRNRCQPGWREEGGGGDLEWHLNGVFIATDDLDFPLHPSIKHSLKTPPRPTVAGGNMPA